MTAKISDNLATLSFLFGSESSTNHETKNTKASMHTAKISSVFKVWKLLVDIGTHLIGKGDDVEFATGEFTVGDRVLALIILVLRDGAVGDLVAL